jgi:hypothetical protein
MPTTITLPDNLTTRLQEKAANQNQSLHEYISDRLTRELEEDNLWSSLEDIVAKSRAIPPDPGSYHPPTASLAELLTNAPHDPTFDLEEWRREWEAVEAEMRAISRADDQAEGRG